MSEQPKHTPGPWSWNWHYDEQSDQTDCGVFTEVVTGHCYSVCRAPRYQTKEQWEADANLIAAAPDMLAALEALTPFAENNTDDTDAWEQAIAAAKAAIAKAKNEEDND